jgi:hypothetical protein
LKTPRISITDRPSKNDEVLGEMCWDRKNRAHAWFFKKPIRLGVRPLKAIIRLIEAANRKRK